MRAGGKGVGDNGEWPRPHEDSSVGLCATCGHARVVTNRRGSRFYRCSLSDTDARFRKYPRLPVLACSGYRAAEGEEPSLDEP